MQIVFQFGGHFGNLLSVGQYLPPLVGEHHRAVDALKQGEVQLIFQLTDLEGNGGLGTPQYLPCLGKAAQLGNVNECGEIF